MRDRACLLVFNQLYTNLTTAHKTLVDNNPGSPATPPAGVAGDAYRLIADWAQWYIDAGTTATLPDQWEGWFVREIAYQLALAVRHDRTEAFRTEAERARKMALQTFTDTALTASSSQDGTYTLKDIRLFVAGIAARQNPPVMMSVATIDREVGWCIRYLWNRANWNFRKRIVSATIDTSSVVTFSMASGETFETLSTLRFAFTDVAGVVIAWANADRMAQLLAAPNQTSSRPREFRMERQAGQTLWYFYPTPDTTYTVKCEVNIACPSLPTSATSTTELAKFPLDLRHILREMVLARCLMLYQQTAAQGKKHWDETNIQIENLIPQYDNRGAPESIQSVQIADADILGVAYGLGGPL